MMIRLTITLLLLVPSTATASDEQWQFRTFSARDGLAHDIVRDVLEDRDGVLWFATMAGITRYHPQKVRYEQLIPPGPSAQVMALAQAADGAVWIATQGGGIARYTKGRWQRRYTTADGLPSDEISSLVIDSHDRIWATPTNGGIALLEPGKSRWRAFTKKDGLSPGEIGRCTELRSGDVLCGTYDQPVVQRFDGKRWSQLVVDAPVRRHFYVHALAEGPGGRLWLATKGAGAIVGTPHSSGSYRWQVHDANSGLASNRVGAVLPLEDGVVWVATSAGVSRFDGSRWRPLARRDGLGANLIFAITRTRDGALWFATLGGGVSRYASSRWRHERTGLASSNITGGLLRSRDDTLWVGTDRGLSRKRAGRWETLRAGDVALDYINDIIETPQMDGRPTPLWVATRQGLRRLQAGTWEQIPADPAGTSGPPHPVVRHLAFAPASESRPAILWAATAGGVASYDGTRWVAHGTSAGLPSGSVNAVLVDSTGKTWAATSNGIAELGPNGRWRAHLSPAPASRTNRYYSLVEDSAGLLWASGLEGVAQRRAGGWRSVQPSNWLPAGIYSRFALTTDDGSLWFAVRGLGVRRLKNQRWTSYTSVDGLAADTVRDVLHLSDGTLLFATLGGGISSYRPDKHSPQTWIGSRDEVVGGNSSALSVLQGEQLTITFAGQDVLKDTQTRALLYSHRLDGGSWSLFRRRTSISLSALAPGAHLLEVRAMDRDLNIDASPAKLRFRVVKPWFWQPWFLAMLGLSVLLVIFAVFRSLRARARERAAMMKEHAMLEQRRHFVRLASHELRKPLSRLAHRAEVLALPETLTNADRASSYAEAIIDDSGRLARLVDSLLHQARIKEGLQLSLQVSAVDLTVREVVADFAEQGHEPQLAVQKSGLQARFDPLYLELALRNLLDNARKYGGSLDAVMVTVSEKLPTVAGKVIEIAVCDNGPGIAPQQREEVFRPFVRGKTDPEHAGFGLGLSFARDIARAHGGDLTLDEQAEGAGCTFRLTLPAATQDGIG